MSKLFLVLSFAIGVGVGFSVSKTNLFKAGKKTKTSAKADSGDSSEDADDDADAKQKRPYVFEPGFDVIAAHYDIAVSVREIISHDLDADRKSDLHRKISYYLKGPGANCDSPNCTEFSDLLFQLDDRIDEVKSMKVFADSEVDQTRKAFAAVAAKLALKPGIEHPQTFRPLGFTVDGFSIYAGSNDRQACKERADIISIVTGNPHIIFVPPNTRIEPVMPFDQALSKAVCVYQQRFRAGKTWVVIGDEIQKFMSEPHRSREARSRKMHAKKTTS